MKTVVLLLATTVVIVTGKVVKFPIKIKIIGGDSVDITSYPYQVSVLFRDDHLCGGSLIKPTVVLTAAHCTVNTSAGELSVRAGSSFINRGGLVRDVLNYIQHPDFNENTFENDVSVLILSQPFPITTGIETIELAANGLPTPANQMSVLTGWGRLYNKGPTADQLQKVEVPVNTDDYCVSIHGSTNIYAGMFCAGYPEGGKDTCEGDSGGPLVINGVQHGITSWGDVCGEANSPGVYAKVSYFRDFIDIIGKVVKFPTNIKIIGGDSVDISSYPYQVSLLYRDEHFCGGSLIKPNVVLTAAHCTSGTSASDLSVRAGSSFINRGGQVKHVANYIEHPNFNENTFENDVSVLILSQPFTITAGIETIELAANELPTPANQMSVLTGWGRLYNNGPTPDQLQKVEVPVNTDDYCVSIHGSTNIDEGMFCAGYPDGGKDTCEGDSGGPLVINGVQHGITSWGDICGEANSPGVYVKVSYFRDFIDSNS